MTPTRTDTVTVDDGSFDLFIWLPESGAGPGIVLIQEIFGVGQYIHDVATRLAEAGYVVGAPDVFWRFAKGWASDHSEAGLGASIDKVQQMDPGKAVSDCVAAVAHLKSLPATGGAAGVLGYCLGGTLAWGAAGHGDPDVCVSYYGSGVPGMLDLVETAACPTLFHFGNQDPYLPNEGVEALHARSNGAANITINVESAGHAFDNHEAEMFYNESAAKAAWAKTMAFLGTHLPT